MYVYYGPDTVLPGKDKVASKKTTQIHAESVKPDRLTKTVKAKQFFLQI